MTKFAGIRTLSITEVGRVTASCADSQLLGLPAPLSSLAMPLRLLVAPDFSGARRITRARPPDLRLFCGIDWESDHPTGVRGADQHVRRSSLARISKRSGAVPQDFQSFSDAHPMSTKFLHISLVEHQPVDIDSRQEPPLLPNALSGSHRRAWTRQARQ